MGELPPYPPAPGLTPDGTRRHRSGRASPDKNRGTVPPPQAPAQTHARGGQTLLGKPPGKVRGHDDVRRVQVADRRAAEPEQGRVDARAEDVEDVADARRAARGQSP